MTNKVCSLGLSKKLKSLGFKQDSIFFWDILSETAYGVRYAPFHCPGLEHYAAFTASELIELLPAIISMGDEYVPFDNYWLHIKKRKVDYMQYIISYDCDTWSEPDFLTRTLCKAHGEKLEDVLAELLIKLKEEKYV